MKIDPADLRRAFDRYIETPVGREWMDNIGFPGWLLLIVSALQVFVGYLLLFTIIWIPRGLRLMAEGITFRPYRQSERKQIQEHLDTLKVIPACGIIVGPMGHAVLLGSVDPIELNELIDLSEKLGEFYMHGFDDEEDAEIVKLMKDDRFQLNRRRRVPSRNAAGHELHLFDVHLKQDDCGSHMDGLRMTSSIAVLAVTSGTYGVHVQVPWAGVKDVFSRRERIRP